MHSINGDSCRIFPGVDCSLVWIAVLGLGYREKVIDLLKHCWLLILIALIVCLPVSGQKLTVPQRQTLERAGGVTFKGKSDVGFLRLSRGGSEAANKEALKIILGMSPFTEPPDDVVYRRGLFFRFTSRRVEIGLAPCPG